jgi:hypothetical protein
MHNGSWKLTNPSRLRRSVLDKVQRCCAMAYAAREVEGPPSRRAPFQSETLTHAVELYYQSLRRKLKRLRERHPDRREFIDQALGRTERTAAKTAAKVSEAVIDDDQFASIGPEELARISGIDEAGDDLI